MCGKLSQNKTFIYVQPSLITDHNRFLEPLKVKLVVLFLQSIIYKKSQTYLCVFSALLTVGRDLLCQWAPGCAFLSFVDNLLWFCWRICTTVRSQERNVTMLLFQLWMELFVPVLLRKHCILIKTATCFNFLFFLILCYSFSMDKICGVLNAILYNEHVHIAMEFITNNQHYT